MTVRLQDAILDHGHVRCLLVVLRWADVIRELRALWQVHDYRLEGDSFVAYRPRLYNDAAQGFNYWLIPISFSPVLRLCYAS